MTPHRSSCCRGFPGDRCRFSARSQRSRSHELSDFSYKVVTIAIVCLSDGDRIFRNIKITKSIEEVN
ncbi:hypothetical protein [Oxynema aestuarii]|uniref:Uncharacterized protein n=1 Tax=Oxynema aestuarii AP17 TaxID=2064643 RepID=A0A6H1U1L9_9CYAN|nr:hypothetical protein [Oxynema aestuarii]QIZ72721.1 hypothetical protein HCG48_20735 [Oxynema aestuarii AP17]